MSKELKNLLSINEFLNNPTLNEMAFRNKERVNKVFKRPYKALLPPKEEGKYNQDKTRELLFDIANSKSNGKCTITDFEGAVKYAVRMGDLKLAVYFIKLIMDSNPQLRKDPNFDRITGYFKDRYEGKWDFFDRSNS